MPELLTRVLGTIEVENRCRRLRKGALVLRTVSDLLPRLPVGIEKAVAVAYQVQREQSTCRLAKGNNLLHVDVDTSIGFELRRKLRLAPREGINGILNSIVKCNLGAQTIVGRDNNEARIGKICDLGLRYEMPGAYDEAAAMESQCCTSLSAERLEGSVSYRFRRGQPWLGGSRTRSPPPRRPRSS